MGIYPSTQSMHPDALRREAERLRRAEERRRHAASISSGSGWWQVLKSKAGNMVDARYPQELLSIVQQEQGRRLVVVEFFAPDCPGCKALYPKFVQIAEQNPSVLFVKANCEDAGIDAVRASLHIPCMPYFVFYKGAGIQDMFSASLRPDKLQRLRSALSHWSSEAAGFPSSTLQVGGDASDECLVEEQGTEMDLSVLGAHLAPSKPLSLADI